ncbi:MAG TPA: PAS domain S-box protein [Vicinamibacterales bacterium]|nr:PAS domain S-box protein [Vicinamibacterales bacterium]
MKILYIGNDSNGVELTAFALQRIAPGVAVAFIPSLKAARSWIEQNRDVAVLTVEVNPDPAACELFIRQVRGLGLTAPLVLVAGGSARPAPPDLAALADATLPKDGALLRDLPTAIGRLLKDQLSQAAPAPVAVPAPAPVAPLPPPAPAKVAAEPARSNPFAHLVPAPDAVQHQLAQTLAMLDQAHRDRDALTAANVELERRIAEAAARLTEERTHANERSSQASAALEALRAQLVDQAAALLKAEQQAAVDRHVAAEDAARHHAKADRDLVRETSTREAAERAAAAADTARTAAEERHAAEVEALTAGLADQKARFEHRLADAAARLEEHQRRTAESSAQATDALDALQAKLVAATEALTRADVERKQLEERQDALIEELADADARLAETAAAAEQRSKQDAGALETLRSELTALTAQASSDRQAAIEAQNQAEARLTKVAASATEREARLEAKIREASDARDTLQAKFAEAETKQGDLTREFAAAAARQTAELANQKHQFELRLAQAADALDALRSELASVTAQASTDRQAAIDAAKTHEATVARHTAALAAADAAHADTKTQHATQKQEFEQRLVDAAAALQALRSELAGVTAQASTDRQAAIDAATTHEAAVARHTAALAAAEAAHAKTKTEHASQLDALTAGHASQKQQFERRLVDAAAALDALRSELAVVNAQASTDRQAAADAATTREAAIARYTAALTAAEAAHANTKTEHASQTQQFEQRLVEVAKTHEAAVARHTATLAAAEAAHAKTKTEHASQLDALTDGHASQKQQFEQRLVEAAAALDALRSELAVVNAQASTDRQAAADAAKTHEAAVERHTTALAAAEAAHADTKTQHATQTQQFEQRLVDAATAHHAAVEQLQAKLSQTTSALDALRSELAVAVAGAKEREARLEEQLRDESAQRVTSERELEEARIAAEQAQRRFVDASNEMRERAREHAQLLEERTARERAEWETTLAERQAQVAQLQRDHDLVRQSLTSREGDLKRLQASHDEQRTRFDRARAAADADLTRLREESTAQQARLEEHRRQFDASPISLCRLAADGTVTQASKALAKLLGYSNAEQIVTGGLAVFDSPDELQWLIDRCKSSRSAQSIESTWRKKDGSRIVVRLVAVGAPSGSIDLAAEDITHVKALEEKLRHAQRLEAVARYASEVAGTCENLLRDVEHAGPQWLSLIENTSTRHQGERLLADVVRVSGFLRQLAEYGGKQKQAVPFADVNSVLRDLTSVLKRVAGDGIEIELVQPKESKPLNLDVETEHVERIFVNIAAYARARMPLGGRLLIDVAPVVVDREFSDRYPSVRPGAHVLFTVTEVKGSALPTAAGILGGNGAAGHDTPGVDLGMLQSLVANCGGHLWISAEPSGDMILKIHLPRRALDDRAPASGPARWISRLAGATRH